MESLDIPGMMNSADLYGLDYDEREKLYKDAIRESIKTRLAVDRAKQTELARSDIESRERSQLQEEMLGLVGPQDASAGPGTQHFPISWGTSPMDKSKVWNNMGYFSNDYSSLQTPQRQLAPAYNERAMREIQSAGATNIPPGYGVDPSTGRSNRDPFQPPPNVTAGDVAKKAKEVQELRNAIKMSQAMNAAKIPVETQARFMAQNFPNLEASRAQRALEAEKAKYDIAAPDRALERGRLIQNAENNAAYRESVMELRRSGQGSKVYDQLKERSDMLEAMRDIITPAEYIRQKKIIYDQMLEADKLMNEPVPKPPPTGAPGTTGGAPYGTGEATEEMGVGGFRGKGASASWAEGEGEAGAAGGYQGPRPTRNAKGELIHPGFGDEIPKTTKPTERTAPQPERFNLGRPGRSVTGSIVK